MKKIPRRWMLAAAFAAVFAGSGGQRLHSGFAGGDTAGCLRCAGQRDRRKQRLYLQRRPDHRDLPVL